MDLEAFFDKEVLVDVLNEAYNNKVVDKEYRLLHKLNEKRVIRVVTAVGESNEEEVDEGLSQGTLESGILSSGSIDGGLMDFFGKSPYELELLGVRVQPMGYQDDILRGSKTIEDTRAGISKLESMANSKNINYNNDKSSLLIDKLEKNLENKLKENPIMLYNKPMHVEQPIKYLGEMVKNSSEKSITATINKRKGQTMLAINEIVTLVNDTRSSKIGGIEVALEVFEMVIIPYLLNSASTWIGLNKTQIESLDKIQSKFLQRVLRVKTAITPLMYWDLGQLLMINRILKMKILLAHHISTLDEKSLANKIWRKESYSTLNGLFSEVKEALGKYNITMKEM